MDFTHSIADSFLLNCIPFVMNSQCPDKSGMILVLFCVLWIILSIIPTRFVILLGGLVSWLPISLDLPFYITFVLILFSLGPLYKHISSCFPREGRKYRRGTTGYTGNSRRLRSIYYKNKEFLLRYSY